MANWDIVILLLPRVDSRAMFKAVHNVTSRGMVSICEVSADL